MKAFTDLYIQLDQTTKTLEKVDALKRYFASASPEDAAWAVYFLSGRKPRQIIPTSRLRAWAAAIADIPDWLFDESYDAVGDLAETIALLLPERHEDSTHSLTFWVEEVLLPMRKMDEEALREAVGDCWEILSHNQRLVFNKLVTGSFRVGVSQLLVTRALAEVSHLSSDSVAHRLMGEWQPTPEFFAALINPEISDTDISRPYPFHLAYQLEESPAEKLGDVADWQIEWKWDGIRAQAIKRGGQVFLWSRGEELVTERFPEIAGAAAYLPDGTAFDGEILPWIEGGVMPFAQLQRRIGRKLIGPKLLREVPVVLLVYDLLELDGLDLRTRELRDRRASLERVISFLPEEARAVFPLSTLVAGDSWQRITELRATSRELKVEGLMLKRLDSPYRVGRHKGDWWKWKIDPWSVDAVMIYAQRGHGRRASLYTDYTFGVWEGDKLVPFAKAYSGLTDEEIRKVDHFIRNHTIEQFGPVRSVEPKLVFELGFEGIQRSTRHKSGIAVRFPRILRWRTDKKIDEADSLDAIKAMLDTHG